MSESIILIGFMGTGKSKVGQSLAARLDLPFYDLDQEIEKKAGMSIGDYFQRYGEAAFRQLEKETLRDLLTQAAFPFVLATGGGVVLDPENRQRLWAAGLVVALEATPEETLKRLGEKRDRPLLLPPPEVEAAAARTWQMERVKALLTERSPLYGKAHLKVDTTGRTIEEVVAQIMAALKDQFFTSRLRVELGERSYDLLLESSGLSRIGEYLALLPVSKRALVVTNATVSSLYAQTITASLAASGFQVHWAIVPDGEEAKSLTWLSRLYDQAVSLQLDRRSPVLALGGGVVGDLAGFFAATYLRGLPLVQIPTTLLAQVDSSVGGKVAVNHPQGKNLIGAFYQPALVLIDPLTLRTLPERELRAGLAEVVKYGVLRSAEFLSYLETNAEAILALELDVVRAIIAFSCQTKAEIVTADEREEGLRSILNFGHTIGHALEAVTGFSQYRHGEAVAIGMIGAAYLAERRGWAPGLLARLETLLKRFGLPTTLPGLSSGELLRAMGYDKKARSGQIRFVLPVAIGKMELVDDLTDEEITAALHFLGAR